MSLESRSTPRKDGSPKAEKQWPIGELETSVILVCAYDSRTMQDSWDSSLEVKTWCSAQIRRAVEVPATDGDLRKISRHLHEMNQISKKWAAC